MRIALAGKGRLGAGLLRGLLQSDHEVVAWVGNGRATRRVLQPVLPRVEAVLDPRHSAAGLAARHRIPPIWLTGNPERDAAALAGTEPDLLLSGDFGMILRPPVLAVPRIGCVNVHWSLLPHHRGPCPSTAVLLAGDPETGVTFHVMTERIDAGAILHQEAFEIGHRDTALSLYVRAAERAEARVAEVVDAIATRGLVGEPQDLAAGSYRRKPTVDEVVLDFGRTAEELDRLVRACISPMPRFTWRGRTIYVSHTAVLDHVDAAPGTVLEARPRVRVATTRGSLLIDVAYVRAPVPWLWPAPWAGPSPGDLL